MEEASITLLIKGNDRPKRTPRQAVGMPPSLTDASVLAGLESKTTFLKFLQFLKPLCWGWKLRTLKQMVERFADESGWSLVITPRWRHEYAKLHESAIPKRIHQLLSLKNGKEAAPTWTTEEIFDTVTDVYEELGVTAMPQCVWTYDAVDVELPEPPKKRRPEGVIGEETPEHVTAMCASSASGSLIPTALLFKGVRIAAEWKSRLSDVDQENVALLVNNSGLCDPLTLSKWLKTVFLKKVQIRPVVLILSSVYCQPEYYGFIRTAFDEQIHIVAVPPKLTSVRLPFATNLHAAFQNAWYEGLDEELLKSPAVPLSRAQVVEAVMPAHKFFLGDALVNAFRDCGLFPVSPHVAAQGKIELPVAEDEDMVEITLLQPPSPETQEAIAEALALFARAGVSEIRAKRLLRNMDVPGIY
ncbi:hypothetical protein BV898_04834 [Hypsibius exemplaris]|uniref:DDE-1 domain-containing protein n=1 Tax=Hypsibius exemplaris TaxID=2072580 RepID=A0A1W0X0T6_HYPEX|nr:hypothetical protein BV898_04834 [Hypsibius exemplaris]